MRPEQQAREAAVRERLPPTDPFYYACPTCWARPGKGCHRTFRGRTFTTLCHARVHMANNAAVRTP